MASLEISLDDLLFLKWQSLAIISKEVRVCCKTRNNSAEV